MSTRREIDGPFRFTRNDLAPATLEAGVRHTLAHFRQWCDDNPASVAAHIDRYPSHLESGRAGRRLFRPGRARRDRRARAIRDLNYFGIYNLGEVLAPGVVTDLVDGARGRVPSARDVLAGIDAGRGVDAVVGSLERHLPALRGLPETGWLADRLDRLHRLLPEVVVRSGGMGKVIRALTGVLVIGAYDTLDAGPEARREHLARIMPAAYALGAAYVIVDDTLHDLPDGHVPPADRDRAHLMIMNGLTTGESIDGAEIPDHPLAEELHDLYGLVLSSHPFHEFRHLYHAAEAMYLAQHRDSSRTGEDAVPNGLETMYQDIFIKAGMSRVIANLIGRRQPDEDNYGRCLNTIFLGQLKDDLRDFDEDRQAGRRTPFTVAYNGSGANPLYDLFAYEAYVVSEVYGGDPVAAETLAHVGAVRLATCLSAGPDRADELVRRYRATSEISRCLRAAAGLPARTASGLEVADTRLKEHCAAILSHRAQTTVDARTFVADRLPYINDIVERCCAPERLSDLPPDESFDQPSGKPSELDEIVAYAMNAPGKRLRPALGLMLAEALNVPTTAIEPLVAASELFHTASLMFDDLPAQDDATVRRGRPTAHTVFDEGGVQLAAVSMISTGFGLLARLGPPFEARAVTGVIAYLGTVLGPARLCRGQYLDLRMGRSDREITGEDILEMYDLKTSTSIEAALVPLMMLVDRPAAETDLVRRYARHAGIVFQIRDDILDLTSSTESLGKDTDNDVGKINLVRVYGLAEARRMLQNHLDEAVDCCTRLPFDTELLKGMVRHFANRRK